MDKSLLYKIKEEFPDWKTSCVKNLLILALCILRKETVCLNKLKGSVGAITGKSNVQCDSHYKRLIRFFDYFAFSRLWIDVLAFTFSLLRLKSQYLILDGTSWQHGNRCFHLMTLCVVYRGVAIPIYWEDLQRKGNSALADRKGIIRKAQRHFNLSEKILLADREYIGEKWFTFLLDQGLDFVIRLRKKNYRKAVDQAAGKSYTALEKKVLRSKVAGKTVGKTVSVGNQQLRFVITKHADPQTDEPLIYLLSSLDEPAAKIAGRYAVRWKIEPCFRHMKSNGFHLEAINVQGKARVNLLMAVVVFAYTLSVIEGLKDYSRVPTKKYADGTRTKSTSVFRHGIEKIMVICNNFKNLCIYISQQIMTRKNAYKSSKAIFV